MRAARACRNSPRHFGSTHFGSSHFGRQATGPPRLAPPCPFLPPPPLAWAPRGGAAIRSYKSLEKAEHETDMPPASITPAATAKMSIEPRQRGGAIRTSRAAERWLSLTSTQRGRGSAKTRYIAAIGEDSDPVEAFVVYSSSLFGSRAGGAAYGVGPVGRRSWRKRPGGLRAARVPLVFVAPGAITCRSLAACVSVIFASVKWAARERRSGGM